MTTVKELIEALSKLDEKITVIMSCDSEGNIFSPYSDLDVGIYTLGDGEFNSLNGAVSPEYGSATFKEWKEFMEDKEKCVAFFPVS